MSGAVPAHRESTATEVVLPGPVEPDGVRTRVRELPAPGPGEALVRMEATGVSFAEQQMRLGRYYDQPLFPFVPGYDVVGVVEAVGPDVERGLVGRRVAAVVKVGGWASRLLVAAGDLVPVPDGIGPAEVEAVLVNGITAWQVLHRSASVTRGGTVVVLGANGGVGSVLVQLARHAGITVVGTASARHHDAVRALGAIPVDYREPDLPGRLRALAPDGVDAVFDHVGGPGLVDSWRLLRRGGTLVNYGSASTKDQKGSLLGTVALFGRLFLWNALPNGKRALFYDFWAGRRRVADFRARHRADLTEVLALVASGALAPQVAARVPLSRAGEALALAESRTVLGKVVIVADS
ncbi:MULTISPECIES: medium chain dehydrogenase/reductase family protein [Actinosynnema]|uniref:medium chain dehydrogenase/reductase family protein n=1 Tax=Actinosynnema TaxID=40566 RepID=UPI0020A47C15|nr:medium chain dehydrogenase/reductase family protein [Actinosynnema pretiosum]MCP2094399.1 NADPH2:quinone reductase [Actinosynnema pretiosum]